MKSEAGLERCLTFINCQLQPPHPCTAALANGTRWRAITLSRQYGSGAHAVAEKLLQLLPNPKFGDTSAWAVFDRNLVEKVLADHHLPSRLARFMPEDRITEVSDTMDELFGLHPPSWTLVHKTAETILHLAELGNVIIIGRGANVITSKLHYVFHVRLVAPLEARVQYVQQTRDLTRAAALELIREEDLGRARYLKKYFHKNVEDPLLYHLIINTGQVTHDEAAHLIGEAVAKQVACP
jgi:hypothetical protein